MQRRPRQSIALTLTISLIGQMLMPTLAFAHDGTLADSQNKVYDQLLDQSHQVQPGQPRGSYGPDRFLLLEQEAAKRTYVGRAFSLFSDSFDRELQPHRARLDRVRRILEQVQALRSNAPAARNACVQAGDPQNLTSAQVLSKVVEHLNTGRLHDHPVFVWEAKNNPALLACVEERVREIVYEWNYKISDLKLMKDSVREIPNITQAPEKEREFYVNWWDARVNVLDRQDGSVVQILDLNRAVDGKAVTGEHAYSCTRGDTCRFSISDKSGVLNRFHLPAKSIVTLGPYVVFIHENSYDAAAATQYLSFVDLAAYGASLGKSDIPVFRLPIASEQSVESLTVTKDGLSLNGGKSVPLEAFVLASEMQQAAFNITANFTDLDSISTIVPYLDSIEGLVGKIANHEIKDAAGEAGAVQNAKVLFDQLGKDLHAQLNADKQSREELLKGAKVEKVEKVVGEYTQKLKTSDVLTNRLTAVSKRVANSRLLRAKLNAFFNRLTSPVPDGSAKVKRALLASGAYNGSKDKFWVWMADRPWLMSGLMSAGIFAAVAPEGAMALTEGGLAIGNAIFDYSKFALLGMYESLVVGTKATFSPIFDAGSSVYKQYIEGDNLFKTAVGLGAFVPTLLSLYYIPHLIFNLHQIALDSKRPDWQGFVEHQRRFQREYYERLAQDEEKRRRLQTGTAEHVKFSEEENREILEFVRERKESSNAYKAPGFIRRSWMATVNSVKKLKEKVSGRKVEDQEKVRGVWSAVMSVTFSYPAMELTLGRWIKFWNWFAGARYSSVGFLMLKDIGLKYNFPIFVRMKPITTATRLIYPDFFSTTVAQRGPRLTIPTELNGGMRGWGVRDWYWLKEGLLGKPSKNRELEDEGARELSTSEFVSLTEEFEKSVTDVEDAVFKAAFTGALKRLPEFIKNKDELQKLYTQAPLKTIVEKRVTELPVQTRTFLRVFFERVYAETMTEYLNTIYASDGANTAQLEQSRSASPGELKNMILELRRRQAAKQGFAFDAESAARIAEKVAARTDVFEQSATQARKGEYSLKNFKLNRKYGVLADMDPEQNGSMKRFSVVQERSKSPNALARATRAEISKLLVTLPLDLAFKLLLAAGIFEGAFKPIQDQMMDSNSIFYLSRDSFYMTFAAGFVMGMMADAWVKLQTDARQDELGDFGMVPKGEDAESSFLRWYGKQFMAKNNSILANWGLANKIAFWNFPAALANMSLFYWAFSGRLDFSYILGGYVLAFATPATALVYKIDQAFERASDYAARGIKDERWMAHPAVQELVAHEKQHYRNRFQLLNDMWGNIQGNWLGNVTYIPTSYGTRGLVRAVFGGSLIEESLVNNVLQPMQTGALAKVPYIGQALSSFAASCEHLLTNGNVDLNLKK